uniref:Uncharacterized protein n=1 Tax=Cyclopterus lumpus TaxID=8103 RepID=A0A8C2WKX5_CYCLU
MFCNFMFLLHLRFNSPSSLPFHDGLAGCSFMHPFLTPFLPSVAWQQAAAFNAQTQLHCTLGYVIITRDTKYKD